MLDSTYPIHPGPGPGLHAVEPPAASAPRPLALRFTGSGAEYFRIWIVNLVLTVVTLGIYSAWAKVRRLQYFDRNTELDGAVFDFTGTPGAILRGRICAVVVLGLYQWAVGFSLVAGVAAAVLLTVLLPFFSRSAMRFRLANTTYRGLRLRFTGSLADAYKIFLPAMLLLIPAAMLAVRPEVAIVFPLFYLLWPLMHCSIKRYQHGNVSYASLPSAITLGRASFYRPYLIAFGILLGVMLALAGCIGVLLPQFRQGGLNPQTALWVTFIPLLLVFLAFAMIGPFLQARLGNLAWSATRFPGVTLASTLQARELLKIHVVNSLLTLVTLGLYRPFAVVKVYRYRLEHLHVTADNSVDEAVASGARDADSAAGDGMADFFDLDLSW